MQIKFKYDDVNQIRTIEWGNPKTSTCLAGEGEMGCIGTTNGGYKINYQAYLSNDASKLSQIIYFNRKINEPPRALISIIRKLMDYKFA